MFLMQYFCLHGILPFSKLYPEIESTWPINSSKGEVALSRDTKDLFVQRFVKVFDQNWNHAVVRSQRTETPADFTVPW